MVCSLSLIGLLNKRIRIHKTDDQTLTLLVVLLLWYSSRSTYRPRLFASDHRLFTLWKDVDQVQRVCYVNTLSYDVKNYDHVL